MDFSVFVGAGGAPFIERFIQLVRVQFKLSSFTASLMVLPLAIVENYSIGFYLHYTPEQMGAALAATLLSVWGVHEISK